MRTSGLIDIIGRRVSAVVITEGDGKSPIGDQIFIVFDDNTWFEIYGQPSPTSGVCTGGVDDAVFYGQKCNALQVRVLNAGD
jgi:hypothetical protein